MTGYEKSLVQINAEAIRILCREIGIVNTLRFLNQYSTGLGNYVEERKKLFGNMAVKEIVAEIKQMKKEPEGSQLP